MGIGSGIFLITLGSIFAFAIRANIWWLDLRAVGWALIFAGIAVLFFTLWYWHDRRRRTRAVFVEENKISHPVSLVPPPGDPPPPGTPQPPC